MKCWRRGFNKPLFLCFMGAPRGAICKSVFLLYVFCRNKITNDDEGKMFENLDIVTVINYAIQVLGILGIVIEITPIKFSPLGWIGKRVNRALFDKIDSVENQVETVKEDLQEHIVDEWRTYILDFQNSCLNGRKHTREEFTRVYGICDKYEKYIEKRQLKNSEIEDAVHYIRKVYKHCLENGEFLIRED